MYHYNESTVRKEIERVDHVGRSLLLKHCKPIRKDPIPFSVTYNPVLPIIKEIINKNWHIQPMIAFRKKHILKTT